ncbi:MAG: THUMP-like domain-containing protein, partial [Phycisphaerales bacterium]
ADVTTDPGGASHAHVDPARRSGSGVRAWRGDDLEPPLSAVAAMAAPRHGASVKLGPGFDLESGTLGDAVEREFIADGWQLVQQVAWTGDLAGDPGCTRATRVDLGCSLVGMPQDRLPAATRAGRALFVPHPALERARLVAHACADLAAAELAPGLGILTGDRCTLPGGQAPWFTAWDVLESMPARERDVARWIAARGGGIVTVHTRGGACDPDRWQAALRGPGHEPMDVFVLREGSALRAYAVRRIGPE